jgi:hypothetical protein
MISFQEADDIVQDSLRTVSPTSTIDSDTPLRDARLQRTGVLRVLKTG